MVFIIEIGLAPPEIRNSQQFDEETKGDDEISNVGSE